MLKVNRARFARRKHPTEDLAAITEGISEVEQQTGTNAGVRKQNNRLEPLDTRWAFYYQITKLCKGGI